MRDDCQSFRDQAADLVSGVLPEQDRHELDKHLTSCADCRAYLQVLRQEDTWLTEHFAGIERDMVERQEQAVQKIEGVHPNEKRNPVPTWRVLMRSPFSKLATAAAVMVVAAVTFRNCSTICSDVVMAKLSGLL